MHLGVEQGAAEVEAFLDVHTDGGALQGAAHLLCDPHKPSSIVCAYSPYKSHNMSHSIYI